MSRPLPRLLLGLLIGGALAAARPAFAHRLDEVLQAARIDIARDRVRIELDLTPGVETAVRLLSVLDANQDKAVDTAEAEAYASLIRSALHLQVDGHPCPLADATVVSVASAAELRDGTGVLRWVFTARLPTLRTGVHTLVFENRHAPDASVYLANALTPGDPAIRIRAQERDAIQQRLEIRFDRIVTRPEGQPGRRAASSRRPSADGGG